MEKKNIVFKCTYNNGNKGEFVGFDGTCSNDIIKYNIEDGRFWCNDHNCECKKYYDNNFKGEKPDSPCYESRLFYEWEYGAGWNNNGVNANTPRHIRNTDIGKIAVLTTRFPNESEEDRRIIGIYKIGDIYEDGETMIRGEENYCIKIPLEETKELYFWDYYNTSNNACFWGHGLFRYIDDVQILQILNDVKVTIRNDEQRLKIENLIDETLIETNITTIPSPNGWRIQNNKNIKSRIERIAVDRKRGSNGEGIDHMRLKEWIGKNPSFLNLKNVINTEIESHVFPSMDLPDIVFQCSNDSYAVVEIETTNTLPGVYQALKYRTLLCAEKDFELNSNKVKTYLVAWKIPEYIKKMCIKYGIIFKEKKI